MRNIKLAAISLAVAAIATPVKAGDLSEMIGTWEWEGFTIEITECAATDICAEVVDGPANVGEQMFLTTPEENGDGWTAEVMHPATGETYYAQFEVSGDVWTMEGCTSSGVCAKGEFIRA